MNPKFDAVLNRMKEIHDQKSSDYANDSNRYSNFESAATAAGTSVDVIFRALIGVKLARLAELQGKGKTPKNESIMDSLIDLAVYATLYASYYEQASTGVVTQEQAKKSAYTEIQRMQKEWERNNPQILRKGGNDMLPNDLLPKKGPYPSLTPIYGEQDCD